MTKYLLLFFVFFVISCDKISDEVIAPQEVKISFLKAAFPDTINVTPTGASFNLHAEFIEVSSLAGVWTELKNTSGQSFKNIVIPMADSGNLTDSDSASGDKIFSGKGTISDDSYSGNVVAELYIQDNLGNTRNIYSRNIFISAKPNEAPVISQLFAPDTLSLQISNTANVRIKVTDANGQDNIKRVWAYNEANPSKYFELFDNGDNVKNGDSIKGDKVFSAIIEFTVANIGEYTFVFNAEDYSGSISNRIKHKFVITL